MIFSGDELLRGDTLNTNQVYLGGRLLDLGFFVTRALCVADDLPSLTAAIADSLARRPSVLVLSGGLGPTEDDLTREAVAAALDLSLEMHDELLHSIQDRFNSRGAVMIESNRKQALLPDGARALPFTGTAPGFALESNGTTLIALPGVPWELAEMWAKHVEPMLTPDAAHAVRRLRVFGLGESMLATKLSDLDWRDPEATIGTRADLDGVTLILRGRATPEGQLKLDRLQQYIADTLGDKIYSLAGQDLPVVVGDLLRKAGLTVSVAESCTGGLLAKRFTDVSGSSQYFLGGTVAYDNHIKTSILGVPETVLAAKGAVSEEVAAAMAEGTCASTGSDCGLSTTGIAGPEGGTQEKPVGLVYVGSVVGGVTRVECLRLFGRRDQIRERAAFNALDLLRRRLQG